MEHGCAHQVASWVCGLMGVHTRWHLANLKNKGKDWGNKIVLRCLFHLEKKKGGVFLTLLTIVTNIKTRIN